MLQGDSQAITLWGDIEEATLALVREEVGRRGVGLIVRPLPRDLDPYMLQPAADVASELLREIVAADPQYGFTHLKLQLPLRTIVIWRTNPNAATDDRLKEVARDNDLTMEFRTASVSVKDAQQLSEKLKTSNGKWDQLGFEILGCFARPTGIIVTIRGDEGAAERRLFGRNHVIGVMDGSVVYTSTQS
jgi:hypothetical protein